MEPLDRDTPPKADDSQEDTVAMARALAREILAEPGASGDGPELIAEHGPAAGTVYALPPPGQRLVIGRGGECDAVVLDSELSRVHTAIEHTPNGALVTDLGSKNGTRLVHRGSPTDGQAVWLTPHEPERVESGGSLAIGGSILRFHDPAAEFAGAVDALASAPTDQRSSDDESPYATPPSAGSDSVGELQTVGWARAVAGELPRVIAWVLIALATGGLVWILE